MMQQVEMLRRAFIKTVPNEIKKLNDGKIHPIATLINTETQSTSLQEALNAAIKTDPSYKNGDQLSIKHLGGSVIPLFSIECRGFTCIFRLLPNEAYINSYKDYNKNQVLKTTFPKLISLRIYNTKIAPIV